MRTTTIEKLADKAIDAIRHDRPEAIESGPPPRPVLALGRLSSAWWSASRRGSA
jgi:hypothetical protein